MKNLLQGQKIKFVAIEERTCDQTGEVLYALEWLQLENGRGFVVEERDQDNADGFCSIKEQKRNGWVAEMSNNNDE